MNHWYKKIKKKMKKKEKKERPEEPVINSIKEGIIIVVSMVISPMTRNDPNIEKNKT